VQSPTYRLDITREIDLIEEMARLTGYDKVPVTPPSIPSNLFPGDTSVPFEKEIRSVLHQGGFYEAVNSSFLPPDFHKKLRLAEGHPAKNFQEVSNPIADDQKVLRSTLLPSLLANVQLNLSHQQEGAALYEFDKVFAPALGGHTKERVQAVAIVAGVASSAQWYSPERKADFYDLKGLAQNILSACGLKDIQWHFGSSAAPYEAGQGFQVKTTQGRLLLAGGAIHPKVLKEYDITVPCLALEIEAEAFRSAARHAQSYSPLPKFPAAWRDIALVVPDGVTSEQVLAAIEECGKPEL
jgi:phenylalanyl-tRNA synthetase beta chain